MKSLKKILTISLVMVLCCGGMVSVASAEMVKNIVLFHDEVTPEERSQYASEWESYGVTTVMDLPFINGLILSVPDAITSADLNNDYRVASVEGSDQQVALQAVGAAADGGAADGGAADGGATNFVTAVDRPAKGHRPSAIVRLNNAPYDPWAYTSEFNENRDEPKLIAKAQRILNGHSSVKKIRIAIFDSGVDVNHSNLDGVVKGGIDLVGLINDGFTYDENGHGTHVAGTLCSKFTSQKFGLIPGTYLFPVKVLDENAIGDVSAIVMGLQWAIDNNIDIINMSVAYAEDSPALRLAVQKAHEAGIIMVAAAGNHSNWDDPAADGGAADGGAADGGAADGGAADGGAADGGAADGGAADGSSAGTSPYPVMYPAAYPEVIAVGASDAFGELASFSNTGPEVDLFAPGTDVVSTNLGGGFGVCSGTSMAVPHVTSAAAMMKGLDPTLTPAEVQSILVDTTVNGELDLLGALEVVDAR